MAAKVLSEGPTAMDRVTLEKPLETKLSGLSGEVELCDESGRILGYFVAPDVHRQLRYEWAKQLFTDEELDRARTQAGGRSTADVLDRLQKL